MTSPPAWAGAPRIVLGKPGLDGHSNGAEVIALAARDAGFEVVYAGIRLTPEEVVQSAIDEGADLIGISVLSGSHLELAEQTMECLRLAGASDEIRVIVGGIIPPDDVPVLTRLGVRQVFTPQDFDLAQLLGSLFDVLEAERAPVMA